MISEANNAKENETLKRKKDLHQKKAQKKGPGGPFLTKSKARSTQTSEQLLLFSLQF